MIRPNTFEDIYRKIDAIVPDKWGCKIWPGMPSFGDRVIVRIGGKHHSVARLVLERKLRRPIRPGYLACHRCDYPPCVNEDHIYEGTSGDNARDKWERNTEYAEGVRQRIIRMHQDPIFKEQLRARMKKLANTPERLEHLRKIHQRPGWTEHMKKIGKQGAEARWSRERKEAAKRGRVQR